jgi:hypothetical protein
MFMNMTAHSYIFFARRTHKVEKRGTVFMKPVMKIMVLKVKYILISYNRYNIVDVLTSEVTATIAPLDITSSDYARY